MRKFFVVSLFLSLPSAALAEWIHIPSADRAQVSAPNGLGLAVQCSPDGPPMMLVEDYYAEVADPLLVIGVDSNPEFRLPAACEAGSCRLDFETPDQARALTAQLRAGEGVFLGLYRQGELARFTLRGSGRAIGAVLGACPF